MTFQDKLYNLFDPNDDLVLTKDEFFEINNRRYLGNKTKLIPFIKNIVNSEIGNISSFCDIFAGTGSVANAFNDENVKIIANDILNSNYTGLSCFLTITEPNYRLIKQKIEYLNSLETSCDNYFSDTYGNTYFSYDVAKKIGNIRNEIDNISEDTNEKNIFLTSLVYAIDKIANTVGHYDAYRKVDQYKDKFKLLIPKIESSKNINNIAFKQDANSLAESIYSDVVYLDPPYNSRQYNSAYHLLENLVMWHKPEVFGISKKMDLSNTKSRYCSKEAISAFSDLINKLSCKYILVSYNDNGKKLHSRSNALISDRDIIGQLERRGEVKIFEKDYKAFSTGKSKLSEVKERLFLCKVVR